MNQDAKVVGYDVTDRRTGKTKRYKTSRAAIEACDRGDWQYGAICMSRRAVWSDQ